MPLGQFGHLELRDCTACAGVCEEVAGFGADCAGKDALPRHACFPCAYAAGENFACPAFRRYGFDCSGAYPGVVVAPKNTRPHGSALPGHCRRPSSITAAAWPRAAGFRPSVGGLEPSVGGPAGGSSVGGAAGGPSVRAPAALEPWPSVGIIGIPRGPYKKKAGSAGSASGGAQGGSSI